MVRGLLEEAGLTVGYTDGIRVKQTIHLQHGRY